jgi:hypothetical protein
MKEEQSSLTSTEKKLPAVPFNGWVAQAGQPPARSQQAKFNSHALKCS